MSLLDEKLVATHVAKRREEALKKLSSTDDERMNIDPDDGLRSRLDAVRWILRRVGYAHVAGDPEEGLIPAWLDEAQEILAPEAIPEEEANGPWYGFYHGQNSQLRGGQEAEAQWLREILPTLADRAVRADFLERESLGVQVEDERLEADARARVREALLAGEYTNARTTAVAYRRLTGAERMARALEAAPLEDYERQATRLRADMMLEERLREIEANGGSSQRYYRYGHGFHGHVLLVPPTAEEFAAMVAPPPTGAAAEAAEATRHGSYFSAFHFRSVTDYDSLSQYLRSTVRRSEAAQTFSHTKPPSIGVRPEVLAEAITTLSSRTGFGGVAVTAGVHPNRRGQRLVRLHARLMITADDGTEVPVLMESELGTTSAKTDAGVDRAMRRMVERYGPIADDVTVELLPSARGVPSRWSQDAPTAAPLAHIIGPERCRHEHSRWYAHHGPDRVETGVCLRCEDCQRSAITYVPLHQIPQRQWGTHVRTNVEEYEAYLGWRAMMAGSGPTTLAEARAQDPGSPSLNAEDYAVGPTRATTGGARTTLRDAFAGRR